MAVHDSEPSSDESGDSSSVGSHSYPDDTSTFPMAYVDLAQSIVGSDDELADPKSSAVPGIFDPGANIVDSDAELAEAGPNVVSENLAQVTSNDTMLTNPGSYFERNSGLSDILGPSTSRPPNPASPAPRRPTRERRLDYEVEMP